MEILKNFVFIWILSTLPNFKADSEIRDCYYNEKENLVDFFCTGEKGKFFEQSTYRELFCFAQKTDGINTDEIQVITFNDCKSPEMPITLNEYKNLRKLDISSWGLEQLPYNLLISNTQLEIIVIANNNLTNIPVEFLAKTSNLIEMDFSFNRIAQLDPLLFENTRKLKTIYFSYNEIESLTTQIFFNLFDLEYLDFSYNRIKTIDQDLLMDNKKLKALLLNNNQVKQLSCEFLITLTQNHQLEILVNTLENVDTSCANDEQSIDLNISMSSNQSTFLQISNSKFNWIFNRNDFIYIRNLNLSSNHIDNIYEIIQEASLHLKTLDMSNHFLGKLNANTFGKFTNLKGLYLRNASMTNSDFEKFLNQSNLEVFDVSYNNLNKINFDLFQQKFQNLLSLNLERNNLAEIDDVTPSHFPKLTILGISKNNFSCEYLVKFLIQWPKLKLIDNPTNEINVNGVDCVHRKSTIQEETIMDTTSLKDNNNDHDDYNVSNMKTNLYELRTIKYISISTGIIVVIICFCTINWKRLFEYFFDRKENHTMILEENYCRQHSINT